MRNIFATFIQFFLLQKAVLIRAGTNLSIVIGHYTAYRLCADNKWHYFDDDQVSVVDEQSVLNHASTRAVMLLYSKCK